MNASIMAHPDSSQVQPERTYNAAADHYDHPALSFWDRFGRRTVERLPLVPGMSVLDVCCGMGGSALPAAERVRETGRVTAVDLARDGSSNSRTVYPWGNFQQSHLVGR